MLDKREMARYRGFTDAMLRKAGADDPAAFAQAVRLLEDALAQLPVIAAQLTAAGPENSRYSWADLAHELGVTRGAAWQRFGPHRLPAQAGDAS